jgi:glycosyltransferase involved in cell wall biosynthesis
MKILIDGYNLGLEHGTGVATYGRTLGNCVSAMGYEVALLYGLDRHVSKDSKFSEVLFFDAARRKRHWSAVALSSVMTPVVGRIPVKPDTVQLSGTVIVDPAKARFPSHNHLWNAPRIFSASRGNFKSFNRFTTVVTPVKLDIAHFTYPLPLRVAGAKNIYTLHDLVPLRLPHTTLDDKKYYIKLCKAIASQADHIVTVSEASRQDIITILGVSPDKVTNTYQSSQIPLSLIQRPIEQIKNELSGIFRLEYKEFFLFFGAIEPKKNIGRMIEAYLGSGVKTPLIIVGAPGWGAEPELKLLKSLGALTHITNDGPRIVQLEYLPLRLLVTLIRGAKATIFPSLYEGFGLPALESMQLGTPVLTSNTGAMPEIAGDAALQVDPYDVGAIARGIRLLDEDGELRSRLSVAGERQAEKFSDACYRERLASLYNSLSD